MNLDNQQWMSYSLGFIIPELILVFAACALLITGFFIRRNQFLPFQIIGVAFFGLAIGSTLLDWPSQPTHLFRGMMSNDEFTNYFRLVIDVGGILTLLMTRNSQLEKPSEYSLLIVSVALGAHLLVMSNNFIMVVLSLELISLSSYALAGWSFSKQGAEGSLKYFLFGSVATAVMIYGISLIYGMAQSLDFSDHKFFENLIIANPQLLTVATIMTLAGFLFKVGAAPMHVWAPDVYQSAPIPVVAFFSVVPKLAGLGALAKFVLALNLFGQTKLDWQWVLAILAMTSITVGNFSALLQTHPKRLMAYSSIAQAGFLLVGIATMRPAGIHTLLFYGAVLLLMNFLVFIALQQYEQEGIATIPGFAGQGKRGSFRSMALTIGLISLVGLPVTAGFTAKLFIFSALLNSYEEGHKTVVLVLLVFGVLNTVISLFYYLRIPYYLFLKESTLPTSKKKNPLVENLLSCILVILILLLFFRPDFLMGWIIRINFGL